MFVLKNNCDKSIRVENMKDGDVGVIVNWEANFALYAGRIVQRHNNSLITLGKHDGESWINMFNRIISSNCRVRLLKDGEELIWRCNNDKA